MFKLIYKTAYICTLKTPYHVTCDMTWSGARPASPAWRSGSGRCRRRTNTSLTPPQPRQVVRLRGVDLQIYKLQSGSQQVDSLLESANLLFLPKKSVSEHHGIMTGLVHSCVALCWSSPPKKLNISQHDNSTACQATQVGAAFGGGVGGVQATPQGLGHLDWLAWKTLH